MDMEDVAKMAARPEPLIDRETAIFGLCEGFQGGALVRVGQRETDARIRDVFDGIAQHGNRKTLYPQIFADFLRSLGSQRLISRRAAGAARHLGGRESSQYPFCTVFTTMEEYRQPVPATGLSGVSPRTPES